MTWKYAFDIFCVLPFVPMAPFILVGFLPWEIWVWKQLSPKARKFIGPYLIWLGFGSGLACGISIFTGIVAPFALLRGF